MQERTLVVAFIRVGDGVCFPDSEEEEEANKFFRWMVTLHYFIFIFSISTFISLFSNLLFPAQFNPLIYPRCDTNGFHKVHYSTLFTFQTLSSYFSIFQEFFPFHSPRWSLHTLMAKTIIFTFSFQPSFSFPLNLLRFHSSFLISTHPFTCTVLTLFNIMSQHYSPHQPLRLPLTKISFTLQQSLFQFTHTITPTFST